MIAFTLTNKLNFEKYGRIVLFTDRVTYCVVAHTTRYCSASLYRSKVCRSNFMWIA